MTTHCPHGEHIENPCVNCEAEANKPTPANEFVTRDEHEKVKAELAFVLGRPSLKVSAEVARARQSEIDQLRDQLTAATQRAEKAELALSALRGHCATLEHADEMWQEHMSPFSDSEGDEAPWITMKREFEQLRDEKDSMEQDISNLLAANDESDHVIQQLRAELEATKADSERRRVDILRWVKRSDESHKACGEMRALLQIWKDNDGYEAVGNSSLLVDGTEHALSTDCGKGWVGPEKLKELRDDFQLAIVGGKPIHLENWLARIQKLIEGKAH